MKDWFLILAGGGGLLIALAHGYIGHSKILRKVEGLSVPLKRVNYAVFHLSTLYWAIGGAGLMCGPFLFDSSERFAISIAASVMYAAGGLANLWAARGKHFGGYLLSLVAILAMLGA